MTKQLTVPQEVDESEGAVTPPAGSETPRDSSYNQRIRVTIFCGAFLLFQVQLLIGKYILPWFGGTPAVWTTCLLFFQVLLLGGYSYSHFVAMRLSPRKQKLLHGGFLLFSILLLALMALSWPSPITPGAAWKPHPDSNPTLLILRFLLVSVGLPFFLLSTTGPLLQYWFSQRNPGVSPYRLYSLSNLGSLLGLLSYPFLIEPNLYLRTQAWLWSAGYFLFAVLCVSVAPWRSLVADRAATRSLQTPTEGSPVPAGTQQLFWVALAACGSAMLLSVTNVISQEVAVSPFLWVLPLCLYLVSFILCFEYPQLYQRNIFHAFFFLAAGGTCALLLNSPVPPLIPELLLLLALIFASCMVAHGEIAVTRPAPDHLTRFYFCISLGGAIGGMLISVVAPLIFSNLWEFPLTILATGGILLLAVRRDSHSWWHRSLPWMPLALLAWVLFLVPAATAALGAKTLRMSPVWFRVLAGLTALAAALVYLRTRERGAKTIPNGFLTRATALGALCVMALGFLLEARERLTDTLARSRNFYGVLAVVKDTSPAGDFLFLRDRMTSHGMQYTNAVLARESTGYYGPNSGINLLLRDRPLRPMRVGLVGLGIGTLASLSRPGDVFRFYEINPDVIRLAQGSGAYFTYLRDAQGMVEIVRGDARLSLEQEAAQGRRQQFDVLVLDAFAGDAIPVHLLTREAFALYREHLRSADSIIAVHITNRNLDLSPVLGGIARDMRFSAVRIHRPWLDSFSAKTDWVFLSENSASLRSPGIAGVGRNLAVIGDNPVWTDNYSNLLQYLR